MSEIRHLETTVDGLRVFYRAAGPADGETVLLLHGYPTGSRMFRRLIPRLAERYRVIAPDHIGFGRSATPTVEEFDYTFDRLTDVTEGLLDQLGVDRFAMYVQDYGAPVGWRLALRRPGAVSAIVSQNGNAYEEGFVPGFWQPVWDYGADPSPEREAAVRQMLTRDAIRWQYVTGVAEPDLLDPDAWALDHADVSRPGNDLVQLALVRDYPVNRLRYPALHEYFRTSQVPLLAVWGDGDEIFGPAGARAFATDLPDAEIHLVPGGHFLLESAPDTVADLVGSFLGRTLASGGD
ncbi:alpha/beta fold hydrolase [Pseudonocardia sp. HH130630-07]|uniref:alpha/beta fold hydrolase n=1 Tax=Pseudonocardia sp. HH130630-07 TaxID=1690815 RepID=UPI0008152A04|nr:alpha/beta fold hydrolase [Pseudonocardia sp. HH130630-07]ANY08561.1 alpha/beta hydrolase [Pseudonocardia sp. HH130630-07]